ncbi:MAG: ABC transporter ATP-binding protein [Anaerolineae bacterium]|nr:ABC transporter ATP-binding protein [Anaerolineae bacterium]
MILPRPIRTTSFPQRTESDVTSVSLAAQQLSVTYTLAGNRPLPALGPTTFAIPAGQFVCLVGPSGCGKSTLVRALAGLEQPTSGTALVADRPVVEPPAQVGIMFQDANLMPWRTVLDNMALPLELTGVARDEREQAVFDLLPQLGLSEFAHAYPGDLSGGMAQRVALGRVLVRRPGALLLDEPFGALDALTREQIGLDLLAFWRQEGQTILMVTHDIHEAVLLADRVLVMSRRPGRLLADIPVTLDRPRAISDTYHEAFGQIAAEVRTAIERA